MDFRLEAEDGAARAATITTDRGQIPTPVFMPVGTVGSVKGVPPEVLRNRIGAAVILANTYHLYLRPGLDVLAHFGGIQPFMGWNGPLLTDSGGYQVFSLSGRRTLSEEGVTFQSHLDGSSHTFTPESVIDMQRVIGSDIMMVLDECPPADVSRDYARSSLERTLSWADRSKRRFTGTETHYEKRQALFGIGQGVVHPDLRREGVRRLVDISFDGYAIGGLSVGEPSEIMYEMVEASVLELPRERPRYLMGVGTPENLIECVARGIDMFDCVMPTRNGRNGMVFTTEGTLNIRNLKWQKSDEPIDPNLGGPAGSVSRGYLRHLFQSNEILGLQIASEQNLTFYVDLMRRAREAIVASRFETWRRETVSRVMQKK